MEGVCDRAEIRGHVEAMLHSPAAIILVVCGWGAAGLVAFDYYVGGDTTSGLALVGTILAGGVLLTGVLVWSFSQAILRPHWADSLWCKQSIECDVPALSRPTAGRRGGPKRLRPPS